MDTPRLNTAIVSVQTGVQEEAAQYLSNVRFGSKVDMCSAKANVR
jgi:hypothetical protein